MWKRLGVMLDMSQTLEQNGIKDDGIHMERVGMDEELYLPAIHLYFRFDNFTKTFHRLILILN